MRLKAPKGTRDVLPHESYKWHYVEDTIRQLVSVFGYKEIRTPVFEHTELFKRGVGDTTDIVQKEMYTFEDKGGRSITLKPEGTAGAVRAYVEHKLFAQSQPVKMYYFTPVFRYERPQAGRLREHHQFGVEVFGAREASVDAEIITMAMMLFERLGIRGLVLNINSIGCHECRPGYYEVLRRYLAEHLDGLCETCRARYARNPLRILDCKIDSCKKVISGVPVVLDYLCDDCREHFTQLQQYLAVAGVEYTINPRIVRGLDYYTRTVFEIISTDIGAQGTVCGGGRYDKLVEQCGGPETPGVGFGMGLERLLLVMENQGINIPQPRGCDVFFVAIGQKARLKAFEMIKEFRKNGILADMDHAGRSIKSQFKYADKIDVPVVCILGEDELKQEEVKIREMATGKEEFVKADEAVTYLKNKLDRLERMV